uniref:Uncharacterized protein n=1 Tax=viral metagenome TaxID=1070528 RepID=A0A6M3X5G7_9ZZZZ
MNKDLIVVKHSQTEEKDKEIAYTVTLKTDPTDNPAITIVIKSSREDVKQQFPLNQITTVTLSTPQKTLGG